MSEGGDPTGQVTGPEDKRWTPLRMLTLQQEALLKQQAVDCMIYGSSYTRMSFDPETSTFGLASIKLEGCAVEYDRDRPLGPPETWRDRLGWRMRRWLAWLRYRIGRHASR